MLAGEVIFLLPFVLPRLFKPTLLAVFEINKTELGLMQSVYGFVALGAYFFGGPLADKVSPHKLMTAALVLTGFGGVYLGTLPFSSHLFWVYGFWGMTTILLFWAALLRTTRFVGGSTSQGKAFGLLDGGRGLVAALIGTAAVSILAHFLPAGFENISPLERAHAFRMVIFFFTGFVFFTAILVFIVLRRFSKKATETKKNVSVSAMLRVLKKPQVWLQALIILCAYSGYRVTDNFSLLAVDVFGYDEVKAAFVGTLALYLRPISAVLAGIFADRKNPSMVMLFCFLSMFIGGITMWIAPSEWYTYTLLVMVVSSTCLGVYAMRGLYFAIMGEAKIPLSITGTVVGLASVIGYLPDIYMSPLTGKLNDLYPGALGHRYVFMLLAGFSVLGVLAVLEFRRLNKKYLAQNSKYSAV